MTEQPDAIVHAFEAAIADSPADPSEDARNADDTVVGENLCDILRRYAEYPWTDSALDFVVWVAQHHPHPSPDYHPVGSVDADSDHLNSLASFDRPSRA